jgi:hypothetical protein
MMDSWLGLLHVARSARQDGTACWAGWGSQPDDSRVSAIVGYAVDCMRMVAATSNYRCNMTTMAGRIAAGM